MPPVAANNNFKLKQRAPLELFKATSSAFAAIDYQMVIFILGALAVTAVGAWWILRERRNMRESSETEYLILESSVSIEIGDDGIEIEYDDNDEYYDGRGSYETVLNSAPAERLTFDMDNLPTFRVSCKPGNILERRGKKTLKLQPSSDGDADMALVDIREGRLTISPFSSKKEPGKLLGDFPPIRRRTPKVALFDGEIPPGIATAPHSLQNDWRPLDTGELPLERK